MPSNYQHLYALATISRGSPPQPPPSPPPSRPFLPAVPYVRERYRLGTRHAAWSINNVWALRPVSRSVIWLRRRRFKSLAPTFSHKRDYNGTYTRTYAHTKRTPETRVRETSGAARKRVEKDRTIREREREQGEGKKGGKGQVLSLLAGRLCIV